MSTTAAVSTSVLRQRLIERRQAERMAVSEPPPVVDPEPERDEPPVEPDAVEDALVAETSVDEPGAPTVAPAKRTPQPPTTALGVRLKRYREQAGMTQAELAEKAECDHSYVSRLQSGARMPTRDAVVRLGEAMGLSDVDMDLLLKDAGFLPRDPMALIANEPAVGDVLNLLQDEAVPSEYRDNIRQQLALIASQARFAITGRRAA